MASREAIRSAVSAYFGALRAMDADGFANTFAPNGVTHDPVGTPPTRAGTRSASSCKGFSMGASGLA